MNHVTHPLSCADISSFPRKISKFCYIKKYRCRWNFDTYFLILLTFLASLKIVLINMGTILMMSAIMATPGFLKTKVFWKKGYDVIIFLDDIINKIFSHDSIYIADVTKWSKFGNSEISTRKVIVTSIL